MKEAKLLQAGESAGTRLLAPTTDSNQLTIDIDRLESEAQTHEVRHAHEQGDDDEKGPEGKNENRAIPEQAIVLGPAFVGLLLK